jgi:serine/threonine protein kinase
MANVPLADRRLMDSPDEKTRAIDLDTPLPGTPSGATADLTPLAARYDLLETVGEGGMGVVYRARDRETGEVVALKVLRPEIAADPAG